MAWHHILTPLARSIIFVAKALFYEIPKFLTLVSKFVFRHILKPTGEVIRTVCSFVVSNLIKGILILGKSGISIAVWTFKAILNPITQAIKTKAIQLFFEIPKFICQHALLPAKEILKHTFIWLCKLDVLNFYFEV